MQLVIEISDDIYKALKDSEVVLNGFRSGKTFFRKVRYAIANGTPLPKGHGRLIDADKLENVLYDREKSLVNEATLWKDSNAMLCGIAWARWYTNNALTVIKADVEE